MSCPVPRCRLIRRIKRLQSATHPVDDLRPRSVARAKKAGYAPCAVDAVAPSASTAAPRAANPFLASNGDDDLIDDETLLLPEDLQRPQVGAVADGCATKRKACKNCTCGRAEREKAEEATGAGVKVNLTGAGQGAAVAWDGAGRVGREGRARERPCNVPRLTAPQMSRSTTPRPRVAAAHWETRSGAPRAPTGACHPSSRARRSSWLWTC